MQTQLPLDQLCSAEDFRAKTYLWLDDVLGLLASVAVCFTNSCGSSANSLPPSFSLKTSLAFCRATKDGIWEPLSDGWGNWGMGGPTECLTLSGSEFPSSAVACSLSDVLETASVPLKYFLSAKACRGILRRAEKRGRELPQPLARALRSVAESIDPEDGARPT